LPGEKENVPKNNNWGLKNGDKKKEKCWPPLYLINNK
jgi:hypothetical protein